MCPIWNDQISNRSEKRLLLNFINQFILEEKYNKYPIDRKAIFKLLQHEWYQLAIELSIIPQKQNKNEIYNLVKTSIQSLSKLPVGFGSTPNLMHKLVSGSKGTDCLGATLILSSILDHNKITYKFISPVGHIAILAFLNNKIYYLDARNNVILLLKGCIHSILSESKYFYKLNFSTPFTINFYSFGFIYKRKEDVLTAIVSNIGVLNNLCLGNKLGASMEVEKQMKAALSIKKELLGMDVRRATSLFNKDFLYYQEANNDIISNEKNRLRKIGFYKINKAS